ncbi:hypothetical protein N4R57_18295 [Rhodobacteraceae bacterium D3-12]|nr:hypothetical protein N4R57_18295 [Rhodobacteraceae bacterium D3-12]
MRSALRAGLAAVSLMALSGCLSEAQLSELGLRSSKTVTQSAGGAQAVPERPKVVPLKQASLAGGKVVVRGPRGYCVDPATLRRGFTGGFALIAACNTISGELSGADVEPVVMTVQVQPSLSKREAPLAASLAAALAPAQPIETIDGDGVTLVHMAGGGNKGLPKGDPKHWRGAMMVNGYLVGFAVYAPKGSALAGAGGKRLILALAENLRDASPVKSYAPQAIAAKPKKQ